jgi:hypothetical protein
MGAVGNGKIGEAHPKHPTFICILGVTVIVARTRLGAVWDR